jgi:hypothetical protein
MSNPELVQEWRERLQDFAESQQTVQQWCNFNRVTIHQYYYWRRRLAGPAENNAANRRWQAVEILENAPLPTPKAGLSLHIAGATIEVCAEFDPILLRAVVAALAIPSC